MSNLYEIATIVLGLWVLVLHRKLGRRNRSLTNFSKAIHMVAEKKYTLTGDKDGFEIKDPSDNEVMIKVRRTLI